MRHDEVELPVVCLVDLKDGADIGVVQRGGGFGLLQEALLGRLVPRQVGREELDRHLALEAGVMRQVDDPHAATPELRGDLVRAESRARGEGH